MNNQTNIFLTDEIYHSIKELTEEEVIMQLEQALSKGWDVHKKYGDEYSFINALHACAINKYFIASEWLLSHGVKTDLYSGNGETAFTFVLGSLQRDKVEVNDFLNYAERLKFYGANLALIVDGDKSPLEIYARYNQDLNQEIVDYLIEKCDFENSFLLNTIIFNEKLCSIKNIKKILQHHTIDLTKKMVSKEGVTQTYWDEIAFYAGSYLSSRYNEINWLHEKLGFDLDSWHNWVDFDGKKETKYHTNLLGFAIQNKNKLMFDWVLKRRPEYLNDKFYVNEKECSLLEFSLLSDFRTAVQLTLRKMDKETLKNLNIPKLKKLCKDNTNHLTLETFQKTYTALIYKEFSAKYEHENKSVIKLKKPKI